MKNLLQKLNSMNILDLRYISRDLGIPSLGNKKNDINELTNELTNELNNELNN